MLFATIFQYVTLFYFFSRHNNFTKGGRMVNIEQERINEAGHLLLEIKCLAKLAALASNSCIDDNELQNNLEYYFVLRQIANLLNKIENLIQDQVLRFITRIN